MQLLRSALDRLLELPLVYRSIQAPFADAKLHPFLERVDTRSLSRVLDVGCGPGTNAAVFSHTDYVGVDINPAYVETARRRHPGRFVVGDVAQPDILPDATFDCVFANSLIHHLPDDVADPLLQRMAGLVGPGGSVHVLDLVMPDRPSADRLLARLDRGRHARSIDAWRSLFTRHMRERHLETYPLGLPGLPLWWMIYFEGVPR
jgi:SAM-dependent methyltransferase